MDPLHEALLWASENAMLAERLPRYRAVRRTVGRFMPGETAEAGLEAAQRLAGDGLSSMFTVLGENVTDRAQATAAKDEYLRLLDRIEERGIDAEISVKLTQLGLDIDMESTAYVGATIDLYETLLARLPNIGLCLQAYLRRTWNDVQRLSAAASIRLVKGAYREPKEHAFQDKRLIDESYFRLACHLCGNARRLALGTHDTDLVARIEAAVPGGHDGFEVAMLYGIRTDEQSRLARDGYAVRTLIAYGPSWYPWFMRRIAEKPVANTLLALRNLV
jgi:proline dehydrogenase